MSNARVLVFKILFLVLIAHLRLASASSNTRWPPPDRVAEVGEEEPGGQIVTAKRTITQNAAQDPTDFLAPETSAVAESIQSMTTATSTTTQVNYAELCYLSNGGSSLTLTVNEATQVGAIIGTVDVNGDPSLESGNVDLFEVPDNSGIGNGVATMSALTRQSSSQSMLDSPTLEGSRRRVLGRRSVFGSSSRSTQIMGVSSEHSASQFYSLLAASSHPAPTTAAQLPAPPPAATNANQAAPQPPVRLEPGTKNLILVRQLDKEAPEAEQSLVVNVRCVARAGQFNSTDQAVTANNQATNSESSTNIPIRILITDANDHAPEFLGPKAYILNISETTPVGTVITRDIIAQDKDSAGPFSTIHYRVLEDGSAQSGLLQFVAPLEPALVLMAPLDYETFSSFTLTVLAQDQGEPEPLSSNVQVQVNVIDFDDQNPRFLDDKYTLIMDESQQSLVGQNLQVLPRNLYAEDGDRGINAPVLYSFDQLGGFQQQDQEILLSQHQQGGSNSGNSDQSFSLEIDSADPALSIERYLHLNPSTGEIRLIRQWPTSGNLASSVPLTLVIRATQADNRDRYALTTLTITRPTPSIPQPATIQQKNRTDTVQKSTQQREGIEFSPDRLNVSVPEGVAVNEKIARVRARYLGSSSGSRSSPDDSSDPVDIRTETTTQSSLVKRIGGSARKHSSTTNENSNTKRPINYQLLDDQTDQFGINGLGEIFVKRTLDYELRQEYKFRVLATYAKHSDICQVQVSVLNLNDNKPKFSQAQYTFHLTESRLRANSFGSVQAHDADLNDAVQYSLLGENAHLFEVSHLGQLTIRSSPNRQLNSSSYQLIVQASDSLAPPIHTHQARLLIQVAPQLVGRPLDSLLAAEHQPSGSSTNFQESRLFNSRSLLQQRPVTGESWPRPTTIRVVDSSTPMPTQQQQTRSSLATVVSSLQHMVRGLNLLDMPTVSALLLAALLAFLVCLLFIVLISMSVHFYRRRSKLRHRHQLAAAARLRHAQLAAINQPDSSGFTSANVSPPDSLSPENILGSKSSSSHPSNQISHHSPCRTQNLNCAYTKTGGGQLASSANYRQQQQVSIKPGALQLQLKVATQGAQINHSELGGPPVPDSSLASTCSDHSKRSYRSSTGTTSDDSSVMHCGHYSINSCRSPTSHPTGCNSKNNLLTHAQVQTQAQVQAQMSPRDSIYHNRGKLVVPPVKSLVGLQKMQNNKAELSAMTNGEPGVRAYRKLPHLGSLVRLNRMNRIAPTDEDTCVDPTADQLDGVNKCQTNELDHMQTDSAIASDVSSSSGSRVPIAGNINSATGAIKWPEESLPQRVKKLTWDDELSSHMSVSGAAANEDDMIQDDDECFLAPDIHLAGPIIGSPLSNHQYPIEGTTNTEDHYAEQHFLFSTPCSPALLSSAEFNSQHFAPTVNGKDNCFDYTIVQSAHFSLDSLTNNHNQHQQPSLSAQHHLLQQQQQQSGAQLKRAPTGYLYSNTNGQQTVNNNNNDNNNHINNNQDLRLMNSAVL